MILYIDTTDFNKVTYVIKGIKLLSKTYKIDPRQSHETLKKFEEFLKLSKIKTGDIQKIIVNKGPGSYTGTRVGVTHAQALGFAWNLPVIALKKEIFEKNIKSL